MQLSSPVTIQPPAIHLADGQVREMNPITLTNLDVTVIDSADRKLCMAQIRPCPHSIVLWQNADYDAAGDYTQQQAEARVLAVLGEDIKAGLEKLFAPPVR
jgi:hypothetical protein